MKRIVTIKLYREYGHPSYAIVPEAILEDLTEELPKVLDKIDKNSHAAGFSLKGIEVE